ncbi:hypothetical protein K443DRAFT_11434 [Laccaria amethystina LaAM-08-1]|uniref:Uncharacterized protein n=1 Tax=Laccaria amethystina LaAM-08-1 TaxID=1095629 RepID=A0A0C9X2F1_9AGAR|nr:hypothetical protein K443DRAFT_11434 [Laccaria amethystina LaAM-08-1]
MPAQTTTRPQIKPQQHQDPRMGTGGVDPMTQDDVEESHDQDTQGHAPRITTTTRDDNTTTKHGNEDATLTRDVNA